MFATGKVGMGVVDHEVGLGGGVSERGCFVMWQMVPDKWHIELVLAGHKVAAGSDGTVAWRHTPWLAPHAAKGGVRPLRRAVQASEPPLPFHPSCLFFFFLFLITLPVCLLMFLLLAREYYLPLFFKKNSGWARFVDI